MKEVIVIFPHQLFKNIDFLPKNTPVFLVEEYLFFDQYNFHKQKIAFHRASMMFYQDYLEKNNVNITYIKSQDKRSDVRKLFQFFIEEKVESVNVVNPTDNWLEKRINSFSEAISIKLYENPLFINTQKEISSFFKPTKKKFFQTSFYKDQRTERNILMKNGEPLGGKWTYDTENRKKYPKDKVPPTINFPEQNSYFKEAVTYVQENFKNNIGALTETQYYPTTYQEAEDWLNEFFEVRFHDFGAYEDAIVNEAHFLNHSLLSPLINVGLLEPMYVINKAIEFADKSDIPINSVEGFVRQILGWREFIRGVYEAKGTEERTKNFWKHTRKIPVSFYDGTTGIVPIDTTIKKVLKTGYAHHIERLMILGNFMLLCEFDPDEVYKWFMELFIDAYDWVMVPNVYGMTLFADGGLMATKPYISSSNYIKKMSNYSNGKWQQVWDGLFWNFMHKNRTFLSKNPRLNMLISNLDKMDTDKRETYFKNAAMFLEQLDNPKQKTQLELL